MRESVSSILISGDEFFVIQRQNYLKAFPGYYSFPGGKVDKADHEHAIDLDVEGVESYLLVSLRREVEEELGIDIVELYKSGELLGISRCGIAITPDFNPHRFKNHYFKIFLKSKVDLIVDEGEAQKAFWINAKNALELYKSGEMLVVPPMISILNDLASNISNKESIDPNLKYNSTKEVPLIRPLGGVNQFLPLSNTFPPANRTNCFYIGDEDSVKVVIDPSPKCLEEYEKLKYSLSQYKVDLIFLTHHHPDHHQFSTSLAKDFNIPMMMSADTEGRILQKYGIDYFEGISVKLAKDGEVLTTSCGQNVKILETPGHDEGQLSLLRTDGAWAIVSDLIQTVGTVLVGDEEGDMNKYFASLRAVISLSPRTIFPSHGIGIGGTNKLEETLKHRLVREDQIHKLQKQGMSPEQMLLDIYPELPARLHKYALLTINCHLKKLADYGLN